MLSSLEQSAVKAGVSSVCAPAESGISWGLHVMDIMVNRTLSDDQFQYTQCFCLDRNPSQLNNNNFKFKDKLVVYSNNIMNSNSNAIEGLVNFLLSTDRNTTIDINRTCLAVYSFSEIILQVGLIRAIQFLKELKKQGYKSIIVLLHSSLHSATEIAIIQGMCNVVINVKPNTEGTFLEDEVAIEVQVIQQSITTGKVSEDYDLFHIKDNQLKHIPRRRITTNKSDNTKTTKNNSSMTSIEDPNGLKLNDMTINTIGNVVTMKPLVTFDMNDPEFDEDEDPDADLDL